MSEENITQLVQAIHEQEMNKKLLAEVRQELKNGLPEGLIDEVRALVTKAESEMNKVVAFPHKTIQLGITELMAASGQELGEWFAQPIVFAANGFVVDIRKVLGSEDDVDVYIYPNGDDNQLIEKTLLPFKDKTLNVRVSVNEKELLKADIYVDETGHTAEGAGYLKSIDDEDVHGKLKFEVIVED